MSYGNPILEWIQAAHWSHHTWEAFEALPVGRQNTIVAAYRTTMQMESVLAHARTKRSKPAAK